MSSVNYVIGHSSCRSGTIRGELALRRSIIRATTLHSVGSNEDPDHDAAMRIGGEAPGWRAQSTQNASINGGYSEHLTEAASRVSAADLIVMHSIGYTEAMAQLIAREAGKPVVTDSYTGVELLAIRSA